MKIRNYIFIAFTALNMTGCAGSPIVDEKINLNASLPGQLNFSNRGFKVISTLINKKAGTMSTLYGNDIALQSLRNGNQKPAHRMALALITWTQRPNPYWYGNNIPDRIMSVELVSAETGSGRFSYKLFRGNSLSYKADTTNAGVNIQRILTIKPSILP